MNVSRRDFFSIFGATAAATALPGCICPPPPKCVKAKIAVQLYSLHRYIGGTKDKDGKVVVPGAGFAKTFRELSAIGYTGVEFAGYYGNDAKTLKAMLDDNGLKAVGAHVGGWKAIQGDGLKQIADFQLAIGNNILICPGGTGPDNLNWGNPQWDAKAAEHMKFITEFFNERAQAAAKLGCRVGIHNHQWEFKLKDPDGVTFWDHFFSNTTPDVLMEQDVGWTTSAGYDPCEEFRKYPGRSPLLHAKENGGPDAILGRANDGERSVDWDKLIATTEANGTLWYVVECEKHFEDLSAVMPSYNYLRSKGLK